MKHKTNPLYQINEELALLRKKTQNKIYTIKFIRIYVLLVQDI